jgi:hypothetical protein
MKYLLSILLVICFSKIGFSQLKTQQERENQKIDLKLEKFRKHHQTDECMSLADIFIASIPMIVATFHTSS